MTTVARADLRELIVRALVAANTSEENAGHVADALVAAEADGLKGHGLSRLGAYADQAASGKVDGQVEPAIVQTATAALRVDARCGFAYPAIAAGLERACSLVPDTGIVAVGVANSHHFGAAGYHVERVANRGFVGLGFGNSPAGIAPWGGHIGVFGTNPIAFAAPRGDAPPLVVDLSMSKVARGKVMVAAQQGAAIPDGWALDPEGRPTTDAKAALAGTMLPMGDAKGAALTLAVELLAAGLTASHFGFEASSFFSAEGEPPRVGQFFLVIDPAAFAGDRAAFLARVEALVAAILEQDGTRLPGSRRLKNRAQADADGLDVDAALYADLKARSGE